jgi:hypothetical protein
MKLARATGLVAAFVVTTAACGEEAPSHRAGGLDPRPGPGSPNVSSAELPDLARALIPPEALDQPVEDELAVEECGIQPVFPCVREYFVMEDIDLDERLALVRRQARSAGWRIVAERREHGVTVEIDRGEYGGTYMLEADDPLLCETAPRCLSGTMLTVYAPPTPLPAPSVAERDSWSAEKKAFVADANAVCAEMQTRMTDPDKISSALADGLEALSTLEPPSGEQKDVDAILRPLRKLVRGADALTDDEGEDVLPAAVAVGAFAKRFNEAASRYGLDACATVG